MKKFLNSLFEDRVDLEPWVNEIEIINQENNTATTRGSTDNFFQNVRELQVAELGIFRDLGPYGRLEE
jgi:hypothetical protein